MTSNSDLTVWALEDGSGVKRNKKGKTGTL